MFEEWSFYSGAPTVAPGYDILSPTSSSTSLRSSIAFSSPDADSDHLAALTPTTEPDSYDFARQQSTPIATIASCEDVRQEARPRGPPLLPHPSQPLQNVPSDPLPAAPAQKRKRGRPRKHPTLEQPVKKGGRSKTGCMTCRRRKKKCDEVKPVCINCQKNNAVCEGYQPPQVWKSGRTKSMSRSSSQGKGPEPASESRVACVLDLIRRKLQGSVSPDAQFLDHLLQHSKPLFGVWTINPDAFRDHLICMAEDSGVLHAILGFAGFSFLNSIQDPSGSIGERALWHCGQAMKILRERELGIKGQEDPYLKDLNAAQAMLLYLKTIQAGDSNGEHRIFLDSLVGHKWRYSSEDPDFQRFLDEFFLCHNLSEKLTSLAHEPYHGDDFRLPNFMTSEVGESVGSFLGAFNQIWTFMSRTTQIRDKVRDRRFQGLETLWDFPTFSKAGALEQEIRAWKPDPMDAHQKHAVLLLYRDCNLVYLYRTINYSRRDEKLIGLVEDGLRSLFHVIDDCKPQSMLLPAVFLLGCAAFDVGHRESITRAMDHLLNQRFTQNIHCVRRVLGLMWQLMDEGSEELSWDWESVMSRNGISFPVA